MILGNPFGKIVFVKAIISVVTPMIIFTLLKTAPAERSFAKPQFGPKAGVMSLYNEASYCQEIRRVDERFKEAPLAAILRRSGVLLAVKFRLVLLGWVVNADSSISVGVQLDFG